MSEDLELKALHDRIIDGLHETIERQAADITAAREMIAVLEHERDVAVTKNERTYCAYCGEVFQVDGEHATDAVGQHISTCDKHPMRRVEHERDVARRERDEALSEVARLEKTVEAADRLGVEIARRRGKPYDRYTCWGEPTMSLADEIARLVVDAARDIETANRERDAALDLVRETARERDEALALAHAANELMAMRGNQVGQ